MNLCRFPLHDSTQTYDAPLSTSECVLISTLVLISLHAGRLFDSAYTGHPKERTVKLCVADG